MSPRRRNSGDDSFLERFLGKPRDPSDLSKNTIRHDRWDEEDKNKLLEEMREFEAAEDRLTSAVDTGAGAFADLYFSLVKADPELEDPKEVRPSHQVNRVVMDEAMQLREYDEMRTYSTNDEIAAALASIAMEPELEILFDKLEAQQKLAQQLDEHLQTLCGLGQQAADIDGMIEGLLAGGGASPEQEEEAKNYQEQKALIEAAIEAAKQQIEEEANALGIQLDEQQGGIRQSMRTALKEGIKGAEQMESLTTAWGLDPGKLHALPAQERIEMARRLNTEKFRKIAQLFGPMHRMAFAEQQRKTTHARDEVYSIEIGNDLSRVLPTEFLALRHPILKRDFYRRFIEGSLLQYELRGTEKLAKGGIIFCEDGSGSMRGDPEIWAKGVGLTLLQIAKSQNRAFYGIHFGGPGKMRTFDFRDPRNLSVEDVIAFAETFFNGGTDFMTPLSHSLDILREEHAREGAVSGDIVFVTDGICGVSEEWLAEFKAEQERISFRVYGICIGGRADSEPLATICDNRVLTIGDFLSGEDVRELFRGV